MAFQIMPQHHPELRREPGELQHRLAHAQKDRRAHASGRPQEWTEPRGRLNRIANSPRPRCGVHPPRRRPCRRTPRRRRDRRRSSPASTPRSVAKRYFGKHARQRFDMGGAAALDEAGNILTASAPTASAARTSVGVHSAKASKRHAASRHASASEGSTQGATMNFAPAFRQASAVAASGTVPAPTSNSASEARSRINSVAFGTVMVISKMRSPASRIHSTAVAADFAVRVRTTRDHLRAARNLSSNGPLGRVPPPVRKRNGANRNARGMEPQMPFVRPTSRSGQQPRRRRDQGNALIGCRQSSPAFAAACHRGARAWAESPSRRSAQSLKVRDVLLQRFFITGFAQLGASPGRKNGTGSNRGGRRPAGVPPGRA